ncbi:hypothetical protein LptCag_2037 [Leptospirillum ferriphilum]|uniref:Uncharacterized protein n=1 Tax=Leptospirillum ferriphilum TaxID=178606 RepID=A0A094WG25_9BACT|nr:hypothetical protein LptCag_2037 [Leptospirillum ferriphilum]
MTALCPPDETEGASDLLPPSLGGIGKISVSRSTGRMDILFLCLGLDLFPFL